MAEVLRVNWDSELSGLFKEHVTVVGKANWYNHYGAQYGDSLKN